MGELSDIVLAYGQSDEYSFVLRKHSRLYERRARHERCTARGRAALRRCRAARSKLISVIVSLFTSHYVMRWPAHFDAASPLRSAPAFDGRVVRPRDGAR
jgi:tRNA(His) guanylyltransferase